ncbi:hypothetical protein B5X24_HaOG207863 [Helicoverpa armigera]|uniref:Uncharacterized protein n=1 Tax=Helicoverpa armigera TaxID=29058 RepID=A0A2W1BP09_HELAM|nr:hypothetical protein B5X24_HaOG207863 [Helicoverpa armigera]
MHVGARTARWYGNIDGRCNAKKPIKVISIHLLTMYGGGGQRARRRGVPRAVSDARPRPAHAARCTAGLCTAHAFYTRLNPDQLHATTNRTKFTLT